MFKVEIVYDLLLVLCKRNCSETSAMHYKSWHDRPRSGEVISWPLNSSVPYQNNETLFYFLFFLHNEIIIELKDKREKRRNKYPQTKLLHWSLKQPGMKIWPRIHDERNFFAAISFGFLWDLEGQAKSKWKMENRKKKTNHLQIKKARTKKSFKSLKTEPLYINFLHTIILIQVIFFFPVHRDGWCRTWSTESIFRVDVLTLKPTTGEQLNYKLINCHGRNAPLGRLSLRCCCTWWSLFSVIVILLFQWALFFLLSII